MDERFGVKEPELRFWGVLAPDWRIGGVKEPELRIGGVNVPDARGEPVTEGGKGSFVAEWLPTLNADDLT